MNFNPPYYQQLLENYGFQPFFHQVCFALKVRAQLQDKFYVRHAQLAADPAYSARHIRKKELEKFVEDFCFIYNKAWAQHAGGKDITKEKAMIMFKQLAMVMDEKLVWFIYHNNEPIGCWLNLPDLNQYFKHLNGQFGLLRKLQFLYLKWTGNSKKFIGLLFGIIPEFQGMGADAYMIVEGAKLIQDKLPYEDYEMQWIGDFNTKMINVAESLGTFRNRQLTTYRYLFDRTKPFKRHPFL